MASDPVAFALQHAVATLGDNIDPLLKATLDAVGTNVTAYFALTVVVAQLRLEGKYTGMVAIVCDSALESQAQPQAQPATVPKVEAAKKAQVVDNSSAFATAADAIQHAARSAQTLYAMGKTRPGASVTFDKYTLRIIAVPTRLCYEVVVSHAGVADRHYSVASLEVDKWVANVSAAQVAASAYMPRDAASLFVNLDKLVKEPPLADDSSDKPLPDDEPMEGVGGH